MTTTTPTRRHRRHLVAGAVLVAAVAFGLSTATPATADAAQARPQFPGQCIIVSIFSDCANGIPGLDDLNDVVSGAAGFVGDQIRKAGEGIINWMSATTLKAVIDVLGEVGTFLDTSTHTQVTADAFYGADGTYRKVATLAGLLLVAFMFCGIIQGLWSGEPVQAMWRIIRDTPIAVFAIVGIPLIVDHVLRIVDGFSSWILPPGQTSTRIGDVFAQALKSSALSALPLLILALLAFFGTIAIYMELVVRASLVYVAVACAPLSFSTIAFPAARPAARKCVELLAAIILSKLVIAIALSTGLDLTEAWAKQGVLSGQGWGYFITGTAILILACLSPFVLVKLMPVVETAVIAQGLSRAPLRSSTQAVQQSYYWRSMIAGRGAGAGPTAPPGRGSSGPAPAAPAPGPSGAARAAATPSTGAGSGAAAGGASAATAAVAVPVVVATAGARQVTNRAEHATTTTEPAHDRSSRRADGPVRRPAGGDQ